MFKTSSAKTRLNPNLRREAAEVRKIAAFTKTAVNVTPGGGVATPGGIRTPTTLRNQTGNPLLDNSLIDSWIPLDNMGLHQLWRRIYLRDPICGSAVDLWRELPWSDFTLGGIEDKKILDVYNLCLKDHLQVSSWLPEISGEFLSLGKVCLHALFDQGAGIFTDLIVHNPDHIEVSKSPLRNAPIKVDLKPVDDHLNFINSTDPRDIAAKKGLDKNTLRLLAANQPIPLDPRNTVYIPRRAFAYDVDGLSFFSRCIYFIALERPLFTASILASRRRAGPITQIRAGNEDWEPTPNELDALAQAFIECEEDAVSAVMATRNDVEINRAVSSLASDMWKISDEYQFISEGKMKALGINDALLSGDATYSTTEIALSVTLERIRAHRAFMTASILVNWICKEVARANDFRKTTEARLSHRIVVKKGSYDEDDADLILPTFGWHKQLRPTADEAAVSLLTTAEEKGLPVGIRDWAGVTGFQLEESLRNMEEDLKVRKQIADYKQKVAKFMPGAGMEGGGEGGGLEGLLGGGEEGEEGAPAEGEEGGQSVAAEVKPMSPQKQAKLHEAIHNDAVRKFVQKMPIWDKRGMCIDIHKEEVIEKLHDADFLVTLSEGHRWRDLGNLVAAKYQWSPRKIEVFGYVMFRLGLVRDYQIPHTLIVELADRLKREGSSNSSSLGLIQEIQFLSMASKSRRNLESSPTLGKVTRLEAHIPDKAMLNGNQPGVKT